MSVAPSPKTSRSRWKLPARYAGVLMPLVLSLLMSCIVAGVATVKSVGLAHDLFQRWMGAWGVSWLVAFPALLVVLPLARRLVAAVVQGPED